MYERNGLLLAGLCDPYIFLNLRRAPAKKGLSNISTLSCRFLLIKAGLHDEEVPEKKKKTFECNRESTVDRLVDQIKIDFPTLTSSNRQDFMIKSKLFINQMILSDDIESL